MADTSRGAVLSRCGAYRYQLNRSWCLLGQQPQRVLGWIMLNPSTADAHLDDPTIRRCVGFAKQWGYDGITVRNLYALRATNPNRLWHHPDPVGDGNDWHLAHAVHDTLTIAAWGAHGGRGTRADYVRDFLGRLGVELHHLGLTNRGQPKHPLYLRGDARPTRWEAQSDG